MSKRNSPAHLLELLWRAPSKRTRGPRPSSTIDEVIAVASSIADRDGLDALSIRAVAERLGVSPMSVYTYVATKDDLFALMVDDVHARMQARRTKPKGRGWRTRATAIALDNRRLYEEHPWLIALPPNRPPLGPGTIAKYEYELAALATTGLPDIELDAALTFVLGFVEACAHAAARARVATTASGKSDGEWWGEHAATLERLFDAAKYPLAARVGAASAQHQGSAYDADHAWEFGLARVLDGLAVFVERAKAGPHGG